MPPASRWRFSGALGRAGTPPDRLDVSAEVTFDKLEAGWRVVSSALTVRGRRARHLPRGLRRGRRGGPGWLPDQCRAGRQCRAERRGHPRRLTGPAVYPIVRSRRGFATVIVSISASETPAARRRGRNDSGQVDVAVALVALELRVVADVLAEQDPVGVAACQELAQELDDAAFAVPLDGAERHPEEVELDRRAALDDREVVVEVRVRVGVADDDAAGIGALLLEDPELGETDVGQHRVGRDRQPGPAGRARGRPMHPLLGRRDPRLVRADLADDPGPDARCPPPRPRSRATSSSARSSTERRSMRASGG